MRAPLLAAAALLALVPAAAEAHHLVPVQDITIAAFAYLPPVLPVPAGATITVLNLDTFPHSVTADDLSFDTGILGFQDEGSFVAPPPGTYGYTCRLHGIMRGTLVAM